MKTIETSIEFIYHYRCLNCDKWWSIADKFHVKNEIIFCPHCGADYRLSAIIAHSELPVIDRIDL